MIKRQSKQPRIGKGKRAFERIKVNKRKVMGILLLLLSLVLLSGIWYAYNKRGDVKLLVVAKNDISAGVIITENDIVLEKKGIFGIKDGYFEEKSAVVGKHASTKISKGDTIFSDKITNCGLSKEAVTAKGKGIVCVPVTISSGLSTTLAPGDRVSVWNFDGDIASLNPVLASIEVFSIENQDGANTSESKGSAASKDDPLPAVVSLITENDEQAGLIIKGVYSGKLHLELVDTFREVDKK